MSSKVERSVTICLCLLVALGTIVPYLVASQQAQPNTFAGFLINPIDGFSYLAKMHQGVEGKWLFQLPYAAEPGNPVFIFSYYLFLGHVADFLQIPLITFYHLARVLAAIGLFWVGYLFVRTFLPTNSAAWMAFLLTIFGAGMGWMFGLFGIETSDLSIPESIPFQTAYTNAHFPLANLLLLGAVLVIFKGGVLRRRAILAFLCGVLLAIVLPFSLASLVIFLAIWLIWEGIIIYRAQKWQAVWKQINTHFIPTLALGVGAGPLLLYQFWLTKSHPVIALWNSQNQTPSPAVSAYLIGYSPLVFLAFVAIFRREVRVSPQGRLLMIWAISNFLLLYAPFNLQRRLTLGLYFPLACLAVIGLRSLVTNPARQRLILISIMIIVLPSNLLLVLTGIDRVNIADPEFVYRQGEVAAYEWLADHVSKGSLILAAASTGNRLPAFADVRVLYGHPFETPNAEQQEKLVVDLFQWNGGAEAGYQQLISLGIEYVFYSKGEMEIGTPVWLSKCDPVYDVQGVRIFQVADR